MTPAPNVLLIMTDQLVPFLTGAYGNAELKTPHLNRLVERDDHVWAAVPAGRT